MVITTEKNCPRCGVVLSVEDLCWNFCHNSEQVKSAEYYCPQCKKLVSSAV